MTLLQTICAALDRAAAFLAYHQLPSGEIPVTLAFNRNLVAAKHDPCVFGSAVTALALRRSDSQVIRTIVARARRHIESQRRADNTWAYWPHWLNVSSDADDTACCSMALGQASGIHHEGLQSNRQFFFAHRNAAGLFQTWFQAGWNITDSVVNANVLCYLGSDSNASCAVDYLVSLVHEGCESGSHPYYANDASLYYAIARAMRTVPALAECRPALIASLQRHLLVDEPDASGFLFRAQSLSALALLGQQLVPDFEQVIVSLMEEHQQPEGGWPAAAFYTGPPGIPRTNWYGSRELSTALCMEALLRAASSVWAIRRGRD